MELTASTCHPQAWTFSTVVSSLSQEDTEFELWLPLSLAREYATYESSITVWKRKLLCSLSDRLGFVESGM